MADIPKPSDQSIEEMEIHVIPQEFYGGIKKPLPKPLVQAAPYKPLITQTRQAPSLAGAPQPSETLSGAKQSKPLPLKKIIMVVGGLFIIVVGGISYYYINQAQKIKQLSAEQTPQIVSEQVLPETTPPIVITTSTVSTLESSTTTTLGIQPLSSAIFSTKTYSQTVDIDSDSLTDVEEALYGTDQSKPDTDGDGYIDGLEVENLYNPLGFKPVRLIDSGRANVYLNPSFNYSIYYPSIWSAQSLDSTNEQVIFSSSAGDYVEVLKVDNPLKLSVVDWYIGQSPGTQASDLKNITTKAGVEGALSPDGLTAYLPFGDIIYVITYNIGLKDQISFLTTFKMMIAGFRYPGLIEESKAAVIVPSFSGTEPTSTAASGSSTSTNAAP